MPKVNYDGILFDSELEKDYYIYLQELYSQYKITDFMYHPDKITDLVGKRSYTPDFLVLYKDHIEVVETKGYNPYSKMIDDQIHNVMLSKSTKWLSGYVFQNIANHVQKYMLYLDEWQNLAMQEKVVYKKIKHLKAYGFVDWDFKNPNTIANKRKEKINEQQDEIKDLKEFKKNAERYFKYHLKIVKNQKLTKPQKEWYSKYVEWLKSNYSED